MKSTKRMASGEGGGAEVSLDSQGCLTLQQVLDAFNAPISEEHAWALFYQGAVALHRGFNKARAQDAARAPARAPRLPAHLYLHRDGTVHSRTLFPGSGLIRDKDDDETDSTPLSEHKMVMNLAMIVYRALDFAQPEDEERMVSADLENLITDMTADDDMNDSESNKGSDDTGPEVREHGQGGAGGAPETDDEGIERDSGDVLDYMPRHFFTLEHVIERCSRHAGRSGAAAHYQAVCRALVVEALELAQFLAKVKDGGARDLVRRADAATSCRELESLRFSDWARFWMQVIGELRIGVKLKKVSSSRTPIEYEMTPYEILMDDIRSRRFNLRKVDGLIPPRVKKDAHAMILEFIRSRPPLKKASERKLPPRENRPPTPREQLLDSIKRGLPLKPMHKETPDVSDNVAVSIIRADPADIDGSAGSALMMDTATLSETSAKEGASAPSPAWRRPREEEPGAPSARPARRLIKVDFEDFGPLDDDDDDELEEVAAAPKVLATPPQPLPRSFAKGGQVKTSTPKLPSPKPWRRTASPPLPPRAPPRTHITHHEYHQFCDSALESYDLATQCPSRRASMRRHTIVACGNPADSMGGSGSHSVPQSRPDSRQSGISVTSSEVDNLPLGTLGGTPNDISWSRNSLQEELIQSVSAPCKKQWQEAMSLDERLSLTLEEIVHIRSVLTKAELEALPVEGRVKEDVEKRKVCFLCLKTRFGIFGPWGQRCKLCKKTVCAKCFSKMRIPTEHFSNVPVVLLSPSLMPSPEDEVHTSFPRSLMARLISPEQNHDRSDNSVGSAPSSPSLQRSQTSSMARSLEGTLNTSSPSHPPSSYVQSAPGSRGGSSLGYVPDQMQTLPPQASIMTRSMEGPQSLPVTNGSPHHTLDRRNRFYRGNTLAGGVRASDRLRGVQMIVCHDCKTMVLQIIKSSRTSRSATRNHTIRNLTLNLSPVYNN